MTQIKPKCEFGQPRNSKAKASWFPYELSLSTVLPHQPDQEPYVAGLMKVSKLSAINVYRGQPPCLPATAPVGRERSLQTRASWARFSTCPARSGLTSVDPVPRRSFTRPVVRACCSIFTGWMAAARDFSGLRDVRAFATQKYACCSCDRRASEPSQTIETLVPFRRSLP